MRAEPPTLSTDAVALDAVAHLVQHARGGLGGTGSPELEARFGSVRDDGAFVPGVSARFFADSVAACEAWGGWSDVSAWVASTDFCYPLGDAFARTTRTGGGTLASVTHLAKRPVARCQLRLEHDGAADAPRGVRVSLAAETPLHADDLPPSVTPTIVRDKRRKSFAWGAWRWDFTRVREGANRAALEQGAAAERYEIEVELAAFAEYAASKPDDAHVATSLLMKLCDLIEAQAVGVRRDSAPARRA